MHEEQPTNLDDVMRALADPTRRAIVQRLRLQAGETRVTDLARPFAMSLNAVSKHIRVVGREHLLSFDPAPLDAAAAWIEAQRAFWTPRLAALDDLLQTDTRVDPPDGRGPQP